MGFQKTVNRQYTQGWVGSPLNDGPTRARPARIAGVAGAPNRIGRAFAVSADIPAMGTTNPAIEQIAVVGGAGAFLGVLCNPKHYALFGTASGGPLDATYDLPDGTEGEFMDMGILPLAVANWAASGGSTTVDMTTKLYYVIKAAAAATGCLLTATADLGRIVALPGVATPDATIFAPLPGSKLTTIIGTLASGDETIARVQLTN